MSLYKAIIHGKEKRKQYNDARKFDRSCRSHGACDYCEGNRLYQDRRNRAIADEKIEEFKNEMETE